MKLHQTAAATIAPHEALQRLKLGNVRFLNSLRHPRDPHQDLDRTKEQQRPFVAIVTCMDSRVSSETVFDLGIGDMFSLRIAGNVITDGIVGSLEYAASVVGTSLIVVLGHSNCGAVKAACDGVELGHLTSLLSQIQPAVQLTQRNQRRSSPHDPAFVQSVAEMNVRLHAEHLTQRSPVLRELLHQERLRIAPAMYDVGTGQVRFLTNAPLRPSSSRWEVSF